MQIYVVRNINNKAKKIIIGMEYSPNYIYIYILTIYF